MNGEETFVYLSNRRDRETKPGLYSTKGSGGANGVHTPDELLYCFDFGPPPTMLAQQTEGQRFVFTGQRIPIGIQIWDQR